MAWLCTNCLTSERISWLPLSIRRVIEHKFYPDETVYFEVEEVQVPSAEGVVIKLRRDDE